MPASVFDEALTHFQTITEKAERYGCVIAFRTKNDRRADDYHKVWFYIGVHIVNMGVADPLKFVTDFGKSLNIASLHIREVTPEIISVQMGEIKQIGEVIIAECFWEYANPGGDPSMEDIADLLLVSVDMRRIVEKKKPFKYGK